MNRKRDTRFRCFQSRKTRALETGKGPFNNIDGRKCRYSLITFFFLFILIVVIDGGGNDNVNREFRNVFISNTFLLCTTCSVLKGLIFGQTKGIKLKRVNFSGTFSLVRRHYSKIWPISYFHGK